MKGDSWPSAVADLTDPLRTTTRQEPRLTARVTLDDSPVSGPSWPRVHWGCQRNTSYRYTTRRHTIVLVQRRNQSKYGLFSKKRVVQIYLQGVPEKMAQSLRHHIFATARQTVMRFSTKYPEINDTVQCLHAAVKYSLCSWQVNYSKTINRNIFMTKSWNKHSLYQIGFQN